MDKIFSNCLLASDVDDTLLSNNTICERNKIAISEFENAGGSFCLSSGRCYNAIKTVMRKMNSIRFAVTLNGAYTYDFLEDKAVGERVFSEVEKELTYKVLEKHPEVCVVVYSGKEIYAVNKNRTCEVHDNYESLVATDVDGEFLKKVKWNKVSFMPEKLERAYVIKELAETINGKFNIVECGANIYGEPFIFVEQTPHNVSKASALIDLCNYLGVEKGNFYSIGDYYNDYEMLKEADISAATSKSPDDIKEIVNFVGGTCEEGAVADFIEYLFKIKKGEAKNGK